jgi:hypothetical protein
MSDIARRRGSSKASRRVAARGPSLVLWGLAMVIVAVPTAPPAAERLGQVFKRVNASVVVIRTREREVAGGPPGRTTGGAPLIVARWPSGQRADRSPPG